MAVTAQKIRLVNPTGSRGPKTRSKRAPRKARTANPGPLYVLGAVNPHEGGHKVAHKKTAKKKKSAARKSNPFTAKVRAMQKQYKPAKRSRKRNPGEVGNLISQPVEMLKFGLIALFGLVATRQVPQMALGAKNESWMGYAANLATAVGGAWGTGKIAGNRAAIAFGTGGGLYTVNRILTDKLTPVGRVLSLAGVGDPQASSSLGRIVPGAVYPPSYDEQGRLRLPGPMTEAIRRLNPPAAATGTTLTGARGASRIAA